MHIYTLPPTKGYMNMGVNFPWIISDELRIEEIWDNDGDAR